MYVIFCNLTRPSSPITTSLSLALDCRSLRLSLYNPAPGSSTRPLLTQPSLSATTLIPAWPCSPPNSDSKSGPVRFFFLFRKDRDQTGLQFLHICPKTGLNRARPVLVSSVNSGSAVRPVSTKTGFRPVSHRAKPVLDRRSKGALTICINNDGCTILTRKDCSYEAYVLCRLLSK